MSKVHLSHWLIQFAIAVALPTVTCFGYYSLEYLDEEETVWVLPAMLAYPVALIGMVGLFRALQTPSHSRLVLLFWLLCILLPASLLLWLRL